MNAEKKLYDRDFYAWTREQLLLLSKKNFDKLDMENLIEEIDSMGKSEQRELSSRIEILLIHLLKWKFQPTLQSRSWELTIKEQRKRLAHHLEENPSLKNIIPKQLLFAYTVAIYEAAKETGFDENFFSVQCPWTIEEILDAKFLPQA